MSKPPSAFFDFLRVQAKPSENGLVKVTVELPPSALDRLYQESLANELSLPAGLEISDEPDEGSAEATTADDALLSIRTQANLAKANIVDRREALQVIAAIVDKHFGD